MVSRNINVLYKKNIHKNTRYTIKPPVSFDDTEVFIIIHPFTTKSLSFKFEYIINSYLFWYHQNCIYTIYKSVYTIFNIKKMIFLDYQC